MKSKSFKNQKIYLILKKIGTELNLGNKIIERAIKIYTYTRERINLRGHKIELLAAVAVYISARSFSKPISIRDFEYKFTSHAFFRAVNKIRREVLPLMGFNYFPISPSELITRVCNELNLSRHVLTKSLMLVRNRKFPGHNPRIVAAAAIYTAAISENVYITQNKIAKHFGISEVSLRNTVKLLMKIPQ